VDIVGFLALGGLFTAHVTGDLVLVVVHFVPGSFGEVGLIWAMPVFIAVLRGKAIRFAFDPPALVRDAKEIDRLGKVRRSARVTFLCMAGFVGGCVAASVFELRFAVGALALPVIPGCACRRVGGTERKSL
jgi:uncharacterized membrane protein YoaK (UPF0700 family)